MNTEIDESDRQVILLAIAHLAVQRPGWNTYLKTVALKFKGEEMFEEFKKYKATEYHHGYQISDDGKSITCKACGRTSHSAGDVKNLYCGFCHRFHAG